MDNPFFTLGYCGPEYFCDREDIVPKPHEQAFMQRNKLTAVSSVKLALNTMIKNGVVAKSDEGYYIYDRYLSLWLSNFE